MCICNICLSSVTNRTYPESRRRMKKYILILCALQAISGVSFYTKQERRLIRRAAKADINAQLKNSQRTSAQSTQSPNNKTELPLKELLSITKKDVQNNTIPLSKLKNDVVLCIEQTQLILMDLLQMQSQLQLLKGRWQNTHHTNKTNLINFFKKKKEFVESKNINKNDLEVVLSTLERNFNRRKQEFQALKANNKPLIANLNPRNSLASYQLNQSLERLEQFFE